SSQHEGLSCEASGCDPRRTICLGGSCVCLPLPWPGCGDGVRATGEECGEPGLPNGPCCVGCRFAGMGTICRPAVNTCDRDEVCNGFSADCPAAVVAPPPTPCGGGDPCAVAETCQGKACVGVQVCAAQLSSTSRTLSRKPPRPQDKKAGVIRLEAGTVLIKAVCTNPAPNVRRAVSCNAQGFLPRVS